MAYDERVNRRRDHVLARAGGSGTPWSRRHRSAGGLHAQLRYQRQHHHGNHAGGFQYLRQAVGSSSAFTTTSLTDALQPAVSEFLTLRD